MSEHLLIPDIEAFEERAAIGEFESDAPREEAENHAAQYQGSRDADYYFAWLSAATPCPG
jgi:hypothetical protein